MYNKHHNQQFRDETFLIENILHVWTVFFAPGCILIKKNNIKWSSCGFL